MRAATLPPVQDALRPLDPHEPLGLWTRPAPPPAHYPELRAVAFELSSCGDRVAGRLLLPPEGDGPFPVAMLQHGAGGSKEVEYVTATAGPWARRGVAVASIDFPLHGERADAKLSAPMLAALLGGPGAAAPCGLLDSLFRQAVVDLQRTADALERLPWLDARRLAYAGFSMGTVIGAVFCGLDPRPRAVALALGGVGLGPPHLDAARYVGRIAPRPLLMLNTTGDETFPRPRVEALFAAASEPKQLCWFEGGHRDLPGAALKTMWQFLRPHLGVDT